MKVLSILSFTVILVLANIAGNAQTSTLSNLSNRIIKADSGQEGAIVVFPEATAPGVGNSGTITYSPASGSFFRIGSHTIIASASTGQKSIFTVTVTDNEAPVLSVLTLSSDRMLTATDKMKKISVYYTATDNAQEVNTVLSVSSNDTLSGKRDWEILNNHLVSLQTSRLVNGETRVYTITVSCADAAGNTTRRTTHISVSKDMSIAAL